MHDKLPSLPGEKRGEECNKHVKGQASHTHSSVNKINVTTTSAATILKLTLAICNTHCIISSACMEIRSNDDLLHQWQILLMYCTQLLLFFFFFFFFPEISVRWKHCAFPISHPHPSTASAGTGDMSFSQPSFKSTCADTAVLHKAAFDGNASGRLVQGGCSVSATGNLREAFCWKNCLCSEPVTHKTRMHSL